MTDALSLEDRFAALWASLRPLGLADRSAGYRRFAWTEADAAVRDWFRAQATLRDLRYEQDRNGNQWAWFGEPSIGAVVTGSHLDSVPDGGAYDGPLGIVSAFLAIDELRARGTAPARPLAVVNFADEEGARFGVACVGSRLLTGTLAPDDARALTDAAGITCAEAMTAAGVDPLGIGRDERTLERIGCFVELHAEQGRALVDTAVGVATTIWPHGRWRLGFAGAANHAGTTGLADRRDPMLPFAAAVLDARTLADAAGAVATVGKVHVVPNATNAIAASVDAWLDVRAAEESTVRAVVADLTTRAESAAIAHGVTLDVRCESFTPAVVFDAALRERLSAALGGVPAVPTGAGHDAGILSSCVPAAMLFVRNPTGVSHSPAEHIAMADCVAGVRALTAVLADLTCR